MIQIENNVKRGKKKMEHHRHKLFMGITSIVILILGLIFGVFLVSNNNGLISIDGINFALLLTTIILLLMNGGLILEMRDILTEKTKKSKRK